MSYHAYIDQSKRRPYRCGICGRDILHAVHQPTIAGLFYVPEPDPEPEPTQQATDFYEEIQREMRSQLVLF